MHNRQWFPDPDLVAEKRKVGLSTAAARRLGRRLVHLHRALRALCARSDTGRVCLRIDEARLDVSVGEDEVRSCIGRTGQTGHRPEERREKATASSEQRIRTALYWIEEVHCTCYGSREGKQGCSMGQDEYFVSSSISPHFVATSHQVATVERIASVVITAAALLWPREYPLIVRRGFATGSCIKNAGDCCQFLIAYLNCLLDLTERDFARLLDLPHHRVRKIGVAAAP